TAGSRVHLADAANRRRQQTDGAAAAAGAARCTRRSSPAPSAPAVGDDLTVDRQSPIRGEEQRSAPAAPAAAGASRIQFGRTAAAPTRAADQRQQIGG